MGPDPQTYFVLFWEVKMRRTFLIGSVALSILLLAGISGFQGIGLAGEEKKIPIHYPGQRYLPNFVILDHYPERFNGVAIFHSLGKDFVILEDTKLPLSPKATYHGIKKGRVSPNSFVAGKRVGYVVNSIGEVESLWMIKEWTKDVD